MPLECPQVRGLVASGLTVQILSPVYGVCSNSATRDLDPVPIMGFPATFAKKFDRRRSRRSGTKSAVRFFSAASGGLG